MKINGECVSEFKIESGHPVPERKGRTTVYPFGELAEVGQSFFVAGKKAQQVMSAAYKFRMAHEECLHHGYVARDVVETGVQGARFWRKEDRWNPDDIESDGDSE